jgi:alkanesulfonate monooxygenase SsuD/methylene tetrahydromethanopterin reductase-like flavin-dependent oxidoreductase (luciferase family)
MRFGFVVPFADAADVGNLAEAAERSGWDGLFVWEPIWGVDAWVALAVAAGRTSRIRLGTMLTPLPRRLPWELAGQVATVDRLSGGRVIVSVGLGAPSSGYESFGIDTDRRTRAERLDEGLDVLDALWRGQPVSYEGRHFHLSPSDFPTIAAPAQQPRPPIWCVGALGSERSMRRVMRCDGLIPQVVEDGTARQATLVELRDAVGELSGRLAADRDPTTFDVVIEANEDEHSPAAWADVGATWWISSMWSAIGEADPVGAAMDHLLDGPPSHP